MKNFKKIVAFAAACACALTVSAPAFAEVTTTASYNEGIVKLNDTEAIDATNQWTVIIIKEADKNKQLQAEDLLYINQGTSAEKFWAEDGMGVLGGELADGDYICRIGGETISDAGDLIEIEFTVSSTPQGREIQLGDIDQENGIEPTDLGLLIDHLLHDIVLDGDAAIAADIDQENGIEPTDLGLLIDYLLHDIAALDKVTVND